MKLVQGKDYFDLMMEMSKPNFHMLEEMGLSVEILSQFFKEVSELEISEDLLEVRDSLIEELKEEGKGIHFYFSDGEKVMEVAEKYSMPVASDLAAAVIPNHLGIEMILIDLSVIKNAPGNIRKMVVQHEMHHIRQLREGRLVYREDGMIEWNGWNPVVMSLEESNRLLALSGMWGNPSEEILNKPWEAEAYGLYLPAEGFNSMMSEEAIEHIMANWHHFGSLKAA